MKWRPQKVSTACYPIWLRADLSKVNAQAYWRGPHGQIANKNPAIDEYLQHHFSNTGHGFWDVPKGIGGGIPQDWKMDGVTEVRLNSILTAIFTRLFLMKANVLDEQNVFDRTLAKNSALNGSVWWTGAYQADTGYRIAVFFRARHGAKGRFKKFLAEQLSTALLDAGVKELRTHIFTSMTRWTWLTPNVCHQEPTHRRYDAMLLIGADDKQTLEQILTSPRLKQTHSAQTEHCVAIHAYAIEHSYPMTLNGMPQI